jgi:hypothetical protein
MQRRGGQQLQTQNGAGKHHCSANQHRLQRVQAVDQRHAGADGEERHAGHQRHQHRLAQHVQQFARLEIEPQQEQQKNDAELGHPLQDADIADQPQSPRPHHGAEHNIGHRQRLARVERHRRDHGGAGKDQEYQFDEGV